MVITTNKEMRRLLLLCYTRVVSIDGYRLEVLQEEKHQRCFLNEDVQLSRDVRHFAGDLRDL